MDRIDDDSVDETLYKELIVNNAIRVQNALSQMEQWSILSNIINYVQNSKNPNDFNTITVKPINKVNTDDNLAQSRPKRDIKPLVKLDL